MDCQTISKYTYNSGALYLRSLHEAIHNWGSKSWGAHCWSEGDKYVDFVIKARMYAKSGKCLSGALTETYVA